MPRSRCDASAARGPSQLVREAAETAGVARRGAFLAIERRGVGGERERCIGLRGCGPAAVGIPHEEALLPPVHVGIDHFVDEQRACERRHEDRDIAA
jgi:hypothetical protein